MRGFENVSGILVVGDNDNDPRAAFENIRRLVHEGGFTPPNRALVATHGTPSIVVMMLPAQDQPGQIETLCLSAMKDTWPTQYECAERFAQCAGVTGWSQTKQEKAKFRAVISHICKTDPNTSLTHAWSDNRGNLIPLDHRSFDRVSDVLADFDTLVRDAQENKD